jgi:hypothetical protein
MHHKGQRFHFDPKRHFSPIMSRDTILENNAEDEVQGSILRRKGTDLGLVLLKRESAHHRGTGQAGMS